jgi:hypothetical protein
MSISLYDASVPVFLRYLERLDGLVTIAQARADAPQLLNACLASDMHPFSSQVRIAAGFALRACYPLAGAAIPAEGDAASSFEELRARIADVVQLLTVLRRSQFDGAGERLIEGRAGHAVVRLPGAQFLLEYALPNFFFHLSTAYAILRQHGVALGKEQFDGWHAY